MLLPNLLSFQLIKNAILFYDNPTNHCDIINKEHGFIFEPGAKWMHNSICILRGQNINMKNYNYELFGCIKYGLCIFLASPFLLLFISSVNPLWLLLFAFVFYSAEAQLVFLFPLLIEDTPNPWKSSIRMTSLAGGTLKVMFTVIPLAIFMIFGCFFGQGLKRSWCIGCLSVILWYEKTRKDSNLYIL